MYADTGNPRTSQKLQVQTQYYTGKVEQRKKIAKPKKGAVQPASITDNILANMPAQQQYQRLVATRAQAAQRIREDNLISEYERLRQHIPQDERHLLTGDEAMPTQGKERQKAMIKKVTARGKRDIELAGAHLTGQQFYIDPNGHFNTSGVQAVGARGAFPVNMEIAQRRAGNPAPAIDPPMTPQRPRRR